MVSRSTLGVMAMALGLLLSAAGGARASTVAGRITGAAIPATGTGAAFVRAVSLQTGEVVAVDDTDAAGRYRLTVPKGAFALFPTVIAKGTLYSPKPTRVRLRRGQRRAVSLPARLTAAPARPIVALPDGSFTGGAGEFSVLNRGLRDMLITDVATARVAACDITVVERSQRLTAVRNLELALVRGGLADPATAIRPGLLITPTRGIRGTIAVSGGRMVLTAEIYKWSSRRTLKRTSVEGAAEEFFQLEPVLARKLAELLCGHPPPVSGTFSGSLDLSRLPPVGQVLGKIEWSGSLELEPQTAPGLPVGIPGLPPGFGLPSGSYTVASGTFTASIDSRTAVPNCRISGQGSFDIPTILAGSSVPALTITDGDPDTYRLALDGATARIPTVLSECPPGQEGSNGGKGEWPLLGVGLLPFSQTPAITTEGVFAGSATGSTPGTDDGYRWTWSFRG